MDTTSNSFLRTLVGSFFTSDLYILPFVIAAAGSLYFAWNRAKQVKEEVMLCHSDPNRRFAVDLAHRLNLCYNVFTTLITIFPLLGMFGTVRALININLNGANEAFKQEFFRALTSTAWGIIWAVIFKLINAILEYRIISQIEAAEKIQDDEVLNTIRYGEKRDET